MCGIVGYIGSREAEPILIEGLRRLEYRGYDSAGLVTITGPQLHLRKRSGRISELQRLLADRPAPGCLGISHTRWATHGPANDVNAHPHLSADRSVAVVHNGVIENYAALKHQLQDDGVAFRSDTDTEVLAHLIGRFYHGDLLQAVTAALGLVKGTYGIAVMAKAEPGGASRGSRLGDTWTIPSDACRLSCSSRFPRSLFRAAAAEVARAAAVPSLPSRAALPSALRAPSPVRSPNALPKIPHSNSPRTLPRCDQAPRTPRVPTSAIAPSAPRPSPPPPRSPPGPAARPTPWCRRPLPTPR